MEDLNPMDLDPGIRDLVMRLRSEGFRTTDSGDGVSKPDVGRVFDFPHVFGTLDRETAFEEADRLYRVVGGSPWYVEFTYSPEDGFVVFSVVLPPEIEENNGDTE